MFIVSESEEAGLALTMLAGGEPLQFGLSTGTDGFWYIDGQKFPGKAEVVEEDPADTIDETGDAESKSKSKIHRKGSIVRADGKEETVTQQFRREMSEGSDESLQDYPYRHVIIIIDTSYLVQFCQK